MVHLIRHIVIDGGVICMLIWQGSTHINFYSRCQESAWIN